MTNYRWTDEDLADRELRLKTKRTEPSLNRDGVDLDFLRDMAKDQAKRDQSSGKRNALEIAMQQRIVAHYRELQKVHGGRLPWLHHSSNEENRAHRRIIDHQMGVSPGVPDLMFYGYGKLWQGPGLAIELKIKPNQPTDNQLAWLKHLRINGWRVEVCYTDQEALDVIYDYCGLGK